MNIINAEDAQECIGKQAYIINGDTLTGTVINEIKVTTTFSSMGEPNIEAVVITNIGEFDSSEIYLNRDEIIAYIDSILTQGHNNGHVKK